MNKIKDIFDTIYYERKKVLIFLVITLSVISYFFVNSNKKMVVEASDDIEIKEEVKEEKEEVKIEKVMVDIKGEVVKPGLYEVENESRVQDVINLAGGLKEDASTDDINLSSKVTDEMVIVINKKEEVVPIESTKTVTVKESSSASITTTNKPSGKVSINSGTIDELCTLNGIKEARAKKIIEYRTTNGPFKSLEDIMNVSGIGEAIFAKIKDSITL